MVDLHIDGPLARLHLNQPGQAERLHAGHCCARSRPHCDAIEAENCLSLRGVIVTAEGDRAFCCRIGSPLPIIINGWGARSGPSYGNSARTGVRLGQQGVFPLREPVGTYLTDRLARLSAAHGGGDPGACLRWRTGTGDGLRYPRDLAPKATLGPAGGTAGRHRFRAGRATQRLARRLPEPVLKEMALFGRRLSADRAHALGYVAEVSDDPAGGGDGNRARPAEMPRRVRKEVPKYQIHAAMGEDRGGGPP